MDREHAIIAIALEICIIFIFIFGTQFVLPTENQQQYWKTLQDVHIMLFVGFGFLMAFLKRYSWSSLGYTFLIGTFGIQTCILFLGLFDSAFCDPLYKYFMKSCDTNKISIDIPLIIRGDFGAIAALISTGAVFGKFTAFQHIVMTVVEMFFFALTDQIVHNVLGVSDIGASIGVHLFGGVFGIVICYYAQNKKAYRGKYNGECYQNNLCALIGTIFLFIYWPSFNGGLAIEGNFSRTMCNTSLCITASALTIFMNSALYSDDKFIMDHILNATLSGGVAIGAAADTIGNPGVAIAIGFFIGIISCFGYAKTGHKFNLLFHDTCGITHLHLIPGFVGGIISVVVASLVEQSNFQDDIATLYPKRGAPWNRSAHTQAKFQVYGILVTIGIAWFSAKYLGYILKSRYFKYETNIDEMFKDDFEWDTDNIVFLWERSAEEKDYQWVPASKQFVLMPVLNQNIRGKSEEIVFTDEEEEVEINKMK